MHHRVLIQRIDELHSKVQQHVSSQVPLAESFDHGVLLEVCDHLCAFGRESLIQLGLRQLIKTVKFVLVGVWWDQGEAVQVLLPAKELFQAASDFISILGLI